MNTNLKIALACFGLVLTVGAPPAEAADDFATLKLKTQLLVDEAKEISAESARTKDGVHAAAFKYYGLLMVSTGTNLLARSESPTNTRLLRSYLDLVAKDYEAYSKCTDSASMAEATGYKRGHTGDRQRVKRRINAEKLGDKELADAIKRWEKFAAEVKRKTR